MPVRQSSNGQVDVKRLLGALRAVKEGDFRVRLPLERSGLAGEIEQAFNDVLELLEGSTDEIERIRSEIHPAMRFTLNGWCRMCVV